MWIACTLTSIFLIMSLFVTCTFLLIRHYYKPEIRIQPTSHLIYTNENNEIWKQAKEGFVLENSSNNIVIGRKRRACCSVMYMYTFKKMPCEIS